MLRSKSHRIYHPQYIVKTLEVSAKYKYKTFAALYVDRSGVLHRLKIKKGSKTRLDKVDVFLL